LFERPKLGERAVLVHSAAGEDAESLTELRELALSAGADPVAVVQGSRRLPDPRFYIGKGKLDELSQALQANQAELALFNNALTPSQERNLEKELGVRVVDRTGLILDIFAQRARSFEGKLQVELAQLRHIATRLVRGWTHLERQKGGIGLRGPGETQLETDKRLIGKRISQIQKRLDRVERQRGQGRVARQKAELPTVGLVGYTNAGKSTLFNALTGASVFAANQLFATLDPTLRRLTLSPALTVVLADTVGFIRHLPHELVAAFRSTLKETVEADLILHVIDVGDGCLEETIAEVETVLRDIGADQVPRMRVFNKVDQIEGAEPRMERNEQGLPANLWLSARTGIGLPLLVDAMGEYFSGSMVRREIRLSAADAGLRSRLYGVARVLKDEGDEDGGCLMLIEVSQKEWGQLRLPGEGKAVADAQGT
jgi:GTP-binding protein HflX